jgi:CHASE2 domain-containing sensor protein
LTQFLSLTDVKTGNFNPDWMRDRVVIIGITAPSAPDLINTSALEGLQLYRQAYEVEFQAHATSQIIRTIAIEIFLYRSRMGSNANISKH